MYLLNIFLLWEICSHYVFTYCLSSIYSNCVSLPPSISLNFPLVSSISLSLYLIYLGLFFRCIFQFSSSFFTCLICCNASTEFQIWSFIYFFNFWILKMFVNFFQISFYIFILVNFSYINFFI